MFAGCGASEEAMSEIQPAASIEDGIGTDETLRRVRVVLVRPRGALNVGSVARAMKNMGLAELTLVAPAFGRRWASTMAVHARDVLDAACSVDTLGEAVADCKLVVGTTCRGGSYRCAAVDPCAAASALVASAASGPVALVFGPEDHGLSNEDLKHCGMLTSIDASPGYPSLNLAQAVLLYCYEVRRAALGERTPARAEARASAGDVEFALARLQEAFLRIGFLNPQNPEHLMFTFRRILGAAALEERDVRVLLGLARQIAWYGSDGWRREDPARRGPAGEGE